MIIPTLILVGAFVLFPLGRSLYLTFFDYSFLRNDEHFVGLANYLEWVTDRNMWHSLLVSIQFFGLYVPVSMLIGLIVALLIDRLANKYLGAFYRTIFYFPVVLPAAIVFQMWLWIYDPTLGLSQLMAESVGLISNDWLGNPDTAVGALAVMTIWRLTGETVIFFLVGLANVPKDLIEAARVDGASEVGIIRKIIIPLLAPIILLVFVLRLKVLELIVEPLFMTEGGPIDATLTYGLQAYYLFAKEDRIGYANTWFILMAVIAVVAAVAATRMTRRYQHD
ncbi:carbohydrate ABC transporter permease [Microlunatus sp. GCM10028923]|uniref:carbohydrate ABC transporter permease n=1 Tax=Microlunatus sp. GCM10028923 TaxID=3273400 RepID=UPI003612B349